MSIEREPIRKFDLTELRSLPRTEAMRIAMIKYQWEAETAARNVDIEQGRRTQERAERKRPQSA